VTVLLVEQVLCPIGQDEYPTSFARARCAAASRSAARNLGKMFFVLASAEKSDIVEVNPSNLFNEGRFWTRSIAVDIPTEHATAACAKIENDTWVEP
jgi:hypothetical protein